jgi:uncharacterized protein YukE
MLRVDADPAALRGFATQLQVFAAFVQETLASIQTGMAGLNASWPDDQGQAFEAAVRSTYQRLSGFIEEARSFVPRLNQDADLLERYQAGKLG